MPCVHSATSGSPLFLYLFIFFNLKINWWLFSRVICCHCNICCVLDSHSWKPLFPFCQYLGICLAQEPADEDFLFVLSHCWSDKYTSSLSSKRKETSCPELKGKICRNSTKGPVITRLHGRMKPCNTSHDKGAISILEKSLHAQGLPLVICFLSITLIFKTG